MNRLLKAFRMVYMTFLVARTSLGNFLNTASANPINRLELFFDRTDFPKIYTRCTSYAKEHSHQISAKSVHGNIFIGIFENFPKLHLKMKSLGMDFPSL